MPRKYKTPKKGNGCLGTIIVFIFAVILAFSVALNIYISMQPPIKNLKDFKPGVVTKIYAADEKEVIKTFTAYNYERKDIKDIPDIMKKAVIATEDKNFYKHKGFDTFGMVRSLFVNIKSRRAAQGASTITQQLARILFLSNERSMERKIKEFKIAVQIEKTLSKDDILGMYLNNIYLGSGAYGVAGAAKIYFNKDLKDLSLAETALIAGLPQAPSVYSPFNNPDKAIKRRNQVLGRMYKMHYIKKDEYLKAKEEPLKLNPMPAIYTLNKAPYFVDYVMKELDMLGFDENEISHGGYKITTTLDYNAQKAVDNAIRTQLSASGVWNNDNVQAAVFTYCPIDGKILAYAGGKNYEKSQFDRVTMAVRQPGSSFKPFVYAAAIEKGMSPNDEIEDLPVKIGKWTPRNYGNTYRGKMPMYAGLMISSNVMTVRLIQEVGIRSVIQIARTLGISTPIPDDYTIALGTSGVRLNEMAVAYGTFANGGYRVTPYAVEKIETSKGKIIYKAPKTRVMKVLDLKTAATVTAMLETVIKSGTGTAADIGKQAAGKTGTTDDYKDAWFVGYTPNVVTGVWVGVDNLSKGGTGMTGGTVPAKIWKAVMQVATEPYGATKFDYPPVEINYTKLPPKKTLNPTEYLEEQDAKANKEAEGTNEDIETSIEAPKVDLNNIKPINSGDFPEPIIDNKIE
ncbi:PBP1A family penicillin-binding protein [bacterium]|nr:PBP1A family penicillin-binding protein [bacterium]